MDTKKVTFIIIFGDALYGKAGVFPRCPVNLELVRVYYAKNIKINKCVKLVVAQNETELDNLEKLFLREKMELL
jgi:hypothetical protein